MTISNSFYHKWNAKYIKDITRVIKQYVGMSWYNSGHWYWRKKTIFQQEHRIETCCVTVELAASCGWICEFLNFRVFLETDILQTSHRYVFFFMSITFIEISILISPGGYSSDWISFWWLCASLSAIVNTSTSAYFTLPPCRLSIHVEKTHNGFIFFVLFFALTFAEREEVMFLFWQIFLLWSSSSSNRAFHPLHLVPQFVLQTWSFAAHPGLRWTLGFALKCGLRWTRSAKGHRLGKMPSGWTGRALCWARSFILFFRWAKIIR